MIHHPVGGAQCFSGKHMAIFHIWNLKEYKEKVKEKPKGKIEMGYFIFQLNYCILTRVPKVQ